VRRARGRAVGAGGGDGDAVDRVGEGDGALLAGGASAVERSGRLGRREAPAGLARPSAARPAGDDVRERGAVDVRHGGKPAAEAPADQRELDHAEPFLTAHLERAEVHELAPQRVAAAAGTSPSSPADRASISPTASRSRLFLCQLEIHLVRGGREPGRR
jgi:hypothetical protein